MIHLTRPQRESLKNVYLRGPLVEDQGKFRSPQLNEGYYLGKHPISYCQFRRGVKPYICGNCVLIPWQGMWLGIEPDGYTHS